MVRVFFVTGPPGPTWVVLIILYGAYRTNGRNSAFCCLLRWQFAVPFVSGFSSFVCFIFFLFHMTYLWLKTQVWLRFLRAQSSYAHVHMVGLSFRFPPLSSFFSFVFSHSWGSFCFALKNRLHAKTSTSLSTFTELNYSNKIPKQIHKETTYRVKERIGNTKLSRPTQM